MLSRRGWNKWILSCGLEARIGGKWIFWSTQLLFTSIQIFRTQGIEMCHSAQNRLAVLLSRAVCSLKACGHDDKLSCALTLVLEKRNKTWHIVWSQTYPTPCSAMYLCQRECMLYAILGIIRWPLKCFYLPLGRPSRHQCAIYYNAMSEKSKRAGLCWIGG